MVEEELKRENTIKEVNQALEKKDVSENQPPPKASSTTGCLD